jgi:Tfp pilus assembly protein PilN
MASDPEAWSIEILPEKLKKRREFLEGPIWLAIAGVLALGYLGLDAVRTSGRLSDARTRARVVENDLKKASQTHHKTEELALENAKLEKTAEALFEAKGTGEQLARSIALLEKALPDELWITQISTDLRADPELRIPKGSERPTVSIAGRAREGTTALSTLRNAFIDQLTKGFPPGTALRDRPSPNGARFTIDLTMFAPPEAAPGAEPPQPGKEDKASGGKPAPAEKPPPPSKAKKTAERR